VKVEGTYYGLVERTDEKGRSFYTINVEGLRVEIPSHRPGSCSYPSFTPCWLSDHLCCFFLLAGQW